MRSSRSLFLALPFLAAALLLPAAAPPALAGPEDPVEIDLSGEMALGDLLRKASAEGGFSVAWDPKDKAIVAKTVTGPVAKVRRDEVLSVLRSILTFFDLALVPVGPAGQEIHMVIDIRQGAQILKLKPAPVAMNDENLAQFERQDGMFITTAIAAPNMPDLRDARNGLQKIVTGPNVGSVQEVPAARAFIVTDFAPNVVAIYRLVKQMDAAAARGTTSRIVTLRNADARTLASLLAVQYGATNEPARPVVTPQGVQMPFQPALRIQGDSRTNLLLVTGPTEAVTTVLESVEALDAPVASQMPEVRLVPVRTENVNAIANMLQNLINASPDLSGRGQGTVVFSSPLSRTLVVRGQKASVDAIASLVKDLEEAANR